jgi:hypothetical protein
MAHRGKADVRGQMREDRGQMTDVRIQRSEDRGQIFEDRVIGY